MSIKIILASLAAILAGIAFLYLFIKGEPKPKEKKPAEQPAAKKVEPPKKTSPQPQKVEPPKKAEPAKPKPAAKPTPSLTDEETISMDKVDHFSEYSAYKQFGYYDQAADSLAKHLETQKMPPHDLVIELCGMYIECGDIDGMITALEKFGGNLNKKELEALVKTAFETEPDNLNLCVFAESKLGWTVEYITRVVQVLSEHKR